MPRVDRLPAPPVEPQPSPPVAVAGEHEVRIPGRAGAPSLEARVFVPAHAQRAVVICHPHPLYGGSMHSPVPLAIAKRLGDLNEGQRDKVAWLRFNFRGIGTSEGVYDDGRGEVDDACAALDYLRSLAGGARNTICGHSFGSFVGFHAAVRDAHVERLLLLAPSTRFFAFRDDVLPGTTKSTVFVGDRDDLCDVEEARALARALRAEIQIFEGFDHHFMKSRRAMADAALPVIAPEACVP